MSLFSNGRPDPSPVCLGWEWSDFKSSLSLFMGPCSHSGPSRKSPALEDRVAEVILYFVFSPFLLKGKYLRVMWIRTAIERAVTASAQCPEPQVIEALAAVTRPAYMQGASGSSPLHLSLVGGQRHVPDPGSQELDECCGADREGFLCGFHQIPEVTGHGLPQPSCCVMEDEGA